MCGLRSPRASSIQKNWESLSRYSIVRNVCVTFSMESTIGQAKSYVGYTLKEEFKNSGQYYGLICYNRYFITYSIETFEYESMKILVFVSSTWMGLRLATIDRWIAHTSIHRFVINLRSDTTFLTFLSSMSHFVP